MDTLTALSLELHLYKTQIAALERLAAQRGVALEDLIRLAIETLLTRAEPDPTGLTEPLEESPLEAFIGLGRSGVGDLSINHDRYLMDIKLESMRQWPEKSS